MKIIVILLSVIFAFGCQNVKVQNQEQPDITFNNPKLDSVKWFYYAYTFLDTALFFKGEEILLANPLECEIKIDTSLVDNDSLVVAMKFWKEGYRFSHVYYDLNPYGFTYFNKIARPITLNVIFKEFNDNNYMSNDNRLTDSAFRCYLRSFDSSKLSRWLLDEAKRRKVL